MKFLAKLETALLGLCASYTYGSLPELLSEGWEIVPPTFETLTLGDIVMKDGAEWRVVKADGCGRFRSYDIYCAGRSHYATLAKDMKAEGYTIPTQPYQTEKVKEMTVAEVSKLVGQPVKIVE